MPHRRAAFTLIELLVVVRSSPSGGTSLCRRWGGPGRIPRGGLPGNLRRLNQAQLYSAENTEPDRHNQASRRNPGRDATAGVNNVLNWGTPGRTPIRSTSPDSPRLSAGRWVFSVVRRIPQIAGRVAVRNVSMNSLVRDPGELTNKFNPTLVQYFRNPNWALPRRSLFSGRTSGLPSIAFFMNRLEALPK